MAFGLALGKLGLTGGKRWTPAQLWPLGASSPGMWSDPPYTASLFQDSAGTTALSAIGTVLDTSNPVGLILDRKGGLALGPELVTNGDFAAGIAGWDPGRASVLSWESGKIRVTNSSTTSGIAQQVKNTVIGKTYRISADITAVSDAGVNARISAFSAGSLLGVQMLDYQIGVGNGYSAVFVAATSTTYISVGLVGGTANTGYMEADNISVREIPGIHLSQVTSTSRGVASARKNELIGTAALATQNVTSKALQYVLSFWGTGSVTLSGTSTAGPLAGTGAGDRVSLTFTPTAGTLTLTVSGTVTNAQLEVVG